VDRYCIWCGKTKSDLLKVPKSNRWACRGGCMQQIKKGRLISGPIIGLRSGIRSIPSRFYYGR
jgi:hypothetical protein